MIQGLANVLYTYYTPTCSHRCLASISCCLLSGTFIR